MRSLKKSLCVLAALLAPLGTHQTAKAGIIPWAYDSIFGYGWGHGYGMPYGGGYGGWGYGGYGAYNSYPVSYAPAPYTTNYAPAYGYETYYGPSLADSCCCDPCSTGCSSGGCSTGGCETTTKSEKQPTPVDSGKKEKPKNAPVDEFLPPQDGTQPAGVGTGTGTGAGRARPGVEESLPAEERIPVRPMEGVGTPNEEMERPAPGEPGVRDLFLPRDQTIAVRNRMNLVRKKIAMPASTDRVVRVDRAVREQLVKAPTRSQVAANP